MENGLVYIWLHRIVIFVSLLISILASYYVNKLFKRMSGAFRDSFELIRNGLFLLIINALILNFVYWGFLSINEIISILMEIFTVASVIVISIGAIKLNDLIDLMPKSFLEKISTYNH